MPATNMKHALIKSGSIVNVVEVLPAGSYSDSWVEVLAGLREKGPWKVESRFSGYVVISSDTGSTELAIDYLERDFADAQRVRHANFDLVADAYPILIEPATGLLGPLGRYVCITMTMGAWSREVPRTSSTVDYRLLDGSLADVFNEMSAEIWDGVVPFDLFDLDDGKKIELNYGNPTLRLSPDQGVSLDVLDTDSYDGEIDADIRRRVLELDEDNSTTPINDSLAATKGFA